MDDKQKLKPMKKGDGEQARNPFVIDPVTGERVPVNPSTVPTAAIDGARVAKPPVQFVHPDQARYDEALLSGNAGGLILHKRAKMGTCSDVEVLLAIRPLLIHPKVHNRLKISGAIVRHRIQKVEDAVEWKKWLPATADKDGKWKYQIMANGLTKENCIKAIEAIYYKDGWMRSGGVLLPPVFRDLTPVILEKETKVVEPTVEETPAAEVDSQEDFATRERWTNEANSQISIWVGMGWSAEEIVDTLVRDSHRKPGLTVKTLQRQVLRLVPDLITTEQYEKYRGRPEPQSSEPGPKDKRTSWDRDHLVGLVDFCKEEAPRLPKSGKRYTGKANCERIARKFNKLKLRKVSGQAVRHTLISLNEETGEQRLGLTPELFLRINDPKEYFSSIKEKPMSAQQAPAAASTPASVKAGDVIVMVEGFPIPYLLTPEKQIEAIEEGLTAEMRQELYRKYIEKRLGQ